MHAMPHRRPPNLLYEAKRKAWYVRKGHGPRFRIKGIYGSPEFMEAYHAAMAGIRLQPKPVKTGSMQWLVERYKDSTDWTKKISEATRRQRENIFAGMLKTGGHREFGTNTMGYIELARDKRSETPAQARNYLDAMRGLFRWAKGAQLIKVDPTAAVENPVRKATDGFKSWTEEDVALYEARWPEGTPQLVWLRVLLYTGVRRGDAVVLGRQHVRKGVLTFITEKGRDRERIEVTRRIDPELDTALKRGPCGDLAFICGERGKPLTKESFGNAFKESCVAAGILDKSAHGLRKLSATIWAERGATEHELMAMFGWVSPNMAALYTRKANRKRLSLSAEDRLGTARQQPNPAEEYAVRESEVKAK